MYSEILKVVVDSETSEISERNILEYFDLNYESRLENKVFNNKLKKYNDLITSNKLILFYLNRNHIAFVSL